MPCYSFPYQLGDKIIHLIFPPFYFYLFIYFLKFLKIR